MSPERPKPFLAAAFTCERILQEKDDVLSAIRIVDTFILPAQATEAAAIQGLRWWVFVSFKAGDATGLYSLSLAMRHPGGVSRPLGNAVAMDLRGGAHGVNFAVELRFTVRDLGLYWIDVFVDRERMTSIPITLRRADPSEHPTGFSPATTIPEP